MKSRSAVTGRYATAKAAKAKPKTHYVSDDYPARMLRKLVRLVDAGAYWEADELIVNIKRKMGWDKPKSVSRKHIVAKPRKVK